MTFAPTHIIVPVDLTDTDAEDFAAQAVDHAGDIAAKWGARVSIVSVMAPFIPAAGFDFSGEVNRALEMAQKTRVEKGHASLKPYVERLKERSVDGASDVLVAIDSVPDTILAYADEHQADLVVMSSHGRKGFKRLLLGSVAERIAHLSKVPVLLLKPKGGDAQE